MPWDANGLFSYRNGKWKSGDNLEGAAFCSGWRGNQFFMGIFTVFVIMPIEFRARIRQLIWSAFGVPGNLESQASDVLPGFLSEE